ncbi:YjcZ family sporulation protein [Bacillus sp. EB600]|nr:YjcZ family sporulation protein [Bacillus sp. EB600]
MVVLFILLIIVGSSYIY